MILLFAEQFALRQSARESIIFLVTAGDMSDVDKLAVTCKILIDHRLLDQRREILDQRREIELLKRQVFWLQNGKAHMRFAMSCFNTRVTRCNCNTCVMRFRDDEDDGTIYTGTGTWECTFQPAFKGLLHEHDLTFAGMDSSTGEIDVLDDHDPSCPHFENTDSHFVTWGTGDWVAWSFGKRLWGSDINTTTISRYSELLREMIGDE